MLPFATDVCVVDVSHPFSKLSHARPVGTAVTAAMMVYYEGFGLQVTETVV